MTENFQSGSKSVLTENGEDKIDKCHTGSKAKLQNDQKQCTMTETTRTSRNRSRTSTDKVIMERNEKRRSLRSTPLAAYDFVDDSPTQATTQNSSKDKKPISKKVSKTKVAKSQPSKSKMQKTVKANIAAAATMVTPKSRTCKVVPQIISSASVSEKKKKQKKPLTPIQQPNLDDISPIVKDGTLEKKDLSKGQTKSLRSAEKTKSVVNTPSLSFIESRNNPNNSNDSAIFVSPRKTMPRFATEKTSTPADVPRKVKKMSKVVLKAKDTSTPIEIKPKKQYTAIKPKKSVSPVQTTQSVETPTSDYCSMELFETPDLSPMKPAHTRKRAHSPNPVFSLEEESESLSLNKSLDKSYKQRSKKKFEASKKADAKINEWIEKVNSELEDIENFELSVEG